MKKKNYITPQTQVKTLNTEMLLAVSDPLPIVPDKTAGDSDGGFAKKNTSIWEEE